MTSSHTARNYSPLPVRISRASGVWAWDEHDKRYLDLLSGYSALSFGHLHPHLVEAARTQLSKVTLTSRAFDHERFEEFCARLAGLCGKEMVLPMNTGAEAVETALKLARKWGRDVRGIESGRIVTFSGNFHGRTTTIVSFSTDPDARDGFGPHTPGFDVVPYGDLAAVEEVLSSEHVAVLVEPIQGEAGVVIPPEGFLPGLRRLCSERNVLLLADEVQSGLGRTGEMFASDLSGVVPDVYILGKALGGGILPVSAIAADEELMQVFSPGTHGSTFGGNPLSCAVACAVFDILEDPLLLPRVRHLGEVFAGELSRMRGLSAVRVRGLWAGIDVDPRIGTGRQVCEALLWKGVLAKEAHDQTLRLAPALVIDEEDLLWGCEQLSDTLTELGR